MTDSESGESMEPMEEVPLKELGESGLERLACTVSIPTQAQYLDYLDKGLFWDKDTTG